MIAAELDLKMLLGFQYVCNKANLTVPWDELGQIMGPNITGSAVIQHLAKTRARMLAKGLDVPPPLRRGGGSSRTAMTTSTTTATSVKTDNVKSTAKSSKSAPSKMKKSVKKALEYSDESDEDDEAWDNDDSDAEYGQSVAKRAKTNARGSAKRQIKAEDSDEQVDVPSKAPKRKTKDTKSTKELSAYGATDINGVPIDDSTDDEAAEGTEVVGAGESWLDLEDDYSSHPTTGKKTPFMKSLVAATEAPVKKDMNEGIDRDSGVVGAFKTGLETGLMEDLQSFAGTNNFSGGFFDNGGDYQSQPLSHSQGFANSFENHGGFNANIPNAFENKISAGTYSNEHNFGSGQYVPYDPQAPYSNAVQTAWPSNHGSMEPSSVYTSVNQTPAATSVGPDLNAEYFGDSQNGFPQFDNFDFGFPAENETVSYFDAENVDGNMVDDSFFGSNSYGN